MANKGWPALWPKINYEQTAGEEIQGSSPISMICVTGDFGLGKSLFGWSIIAQPKGMLAPIAVWDGENSGGDYLQTRAADYHDIRGLEPIDAWQMFEAWVHSLQPGLYAVCLIDTIEPIEDGLKEYVFANARLFNKTPGQYSKGIDRSGLYWGDVKNHLRKTLNELASKVQTIVAVRHLRQAYSGSNPIPNKYEPKGLDTWELLSVISAWLVPGASGVPGQGAPSAVLTKRRMDFPDWSMPDEYGVPTIRPILPRFMVEFTPAAIRGFMKNPREFTAKEMSNVDPSILALNEDQRLMMRTAIADQERAVAEEKEKAQTNDGKKRLASELVASGYFSEDKVVLKDQISAGLQATKHTYHLNQHDAIREDLIKWAQKQIEGLDSTAETEVESGVAAE